ncbi:hypothetical protein C5C31_04925 [Rathayibacter rathayi]|uniref:DUF732 domain-containing protein n=1 Tax=Rathayibacter rathayi TaxID=33887 RepID=A0ABD6W9K0_RATRA|nr:hypothetical protein [Rathayibacter rathayi]PPF14167.1 hypothetical protein C5C04_07740 [Rathayibacter rathayi]PPF24040.1 hypothetical protein C5C34_06690 [Rathayibacter rathayi]PPF80063.1 hypothetical protein C5C14_07250 [Rathayibacter rathayi]PPG13320.1 hypothetical protein C5C11_07245 [Rathayibacter rathayi]PPG43073.1 hypothetical protein C5C20_08920 [Rathayibacter rathayi]
MSRSLKSAVAAVLAAAALAGCSAAPAEPTPGQPMGAGQIRALAQEEGEAGHAQQQAALEDGAVTFQEYDEAFARLEACLTDHGVTVEGPVVSPVDGVRYEFSSDFGSREQSAALSDIDECNAVHWASVAKAYELSQPQSMDPPLVEATSACLRARGLDPAPEADVVAEFVTSVGEENGDAVLDCVQHEGARLYPDLPSLTAGY